MRWSTAQGALPDVKGKSNLEKAKSFMLDVPAAKRNHAHKLIIGIFLGLIFLYLSFRNVDFGKMAASLSGANYWDVAISILILMLSHYFRVLRWQLLLFPIKKTSIRGLFSALSIGYAANTFLPGHLGELFRAYIVGKREGVSAVTTFASIVLERIIDVVSLVAIMGVVIFAHPFPGWIINCGIAMFFFVIVLLVVMIFFKMYRDKYYFLIDAFLKILPEKYRLNVKATINNFYNGLVPLKNNYHYIYVFLLTALIWICYGLVYYFCLRAFDLNEIYDLPWYVGIVVLVITTISIVVPTSPGYIGTYHFLCQISLAIFGVTASDALSYASVAHAINIIPITIVGLIFANLEGIAFYRKKSLKMVDRKVA